MIADDAQLKRHAGMLAVTDRGRHAGIRHRHNNINVDVTFAGKLRAEGFTHLIDRASTDNGVRPREINVFENAGAWRLRRERLVNFGLDDRTLVVEHDDFAGLDVANVFRANDVERTGFRRENWAAVEFAVHQRANAERVARADQLFVGQRDECVSAFDGA